MSITYPKIVLFILLAGTVSAQPAIPFFQQITEQQGMVQSLCSYFHRDREGYLWVGTHSGIGRFDGKNVTFFQHNSKTIKGITGNEATSRFFEDTIRRQIWFSTNRGIQCYRYLKHDFNYLKTTANHQLLYLETDAQALWSIKDDLLININVLIEEQGQSTTVGKLPSDYNWQALESKSKNRLTGIFGQKQDNGKVTLTWNMLREGQLSSWNQVLFPHEVYAFLQANDDLCWIGTSDGLYQLNLNTAKLTPIDVTVGDICSMIQYDEQCLLIGVYDIGIKVYNVLTRQVERVYNADNTIPVKLINTRLETLYLDHENILWVSSWQGTFFSALNKIKFELYPLSQNEAPKALFSNNRNGIFYGSDFKEIIGSYQQEQDDFITSKFPLSISFAYPILPNAAIVAPTMEVPDPNNQRAVVYQWAPVKQFTRITNQQLENINVTAAVKLKNNQIIIGNTDGLFEINQQSSQWIATPLTTNLKNITALFQDSSGFIWIGHDSERLTVLKFLGKKWQIEHADTVYRSVKCFAQTSNNIWVGGDFGLYRYERSNIKQRYLFNEDNGLPNNKIYGILPDKQGNLWMSSNRGLILFQPQVVRFSDFNPTDGLQGYEYNANSFCIDSAGNYWMGGMKGINRFRPDQVLNQLNQFDYQPVITDIKINYESYLKLHPDAPLNPNEFVKKALYLESDENNLQFTVAALDLSDATNQTILYTLSTSHQIPADSQWIQLAGPQAVLNFNQLKYGKYWLHIKIVNADGVWSKTSLIMEITIETPLYLQPWFLIASAILFVVGVLVYARWRIRQKTEWQRLQLVEKDFEISKMRAIDQEKQRISDEMHDDLGGILTTIVRMLERIADEPQSSNIQASIKNVATKADEAYRNMRDIIWALNSENNSLSATFAYLIERTSQFLQDNQLEFDVTTLSSVPEIELSSGQRRGLTLAVKEALHNIVKHAEATQVEMIFEQPSEQQVRLRIIDDGKGISSETVTQIGNGNGMRTMKNNLKALNGQVTIGTGLNQQGTEIVFDINFL
jgi:signal transduction histidine kinase/ligand-binding sensor domain-containing protein